MGEKIEAREHIKRNFRIGGRAELIVLLHERGSSSQEIAERYGLSLSEVEQAIGRCPSSD